MTFANKLVRRLTVFRARRFYCQTSSSTDPPILNKAMLRKLERLSALRFKSIEEIRALEEAIRLSDKIFEVDTTGIEPLHTLVDEFITCPLREDVPISTDSINSSLESVQGVATTIKRPSEPIALVNAAETFEGYFITARSNITLSENPLFDLLDEQGKEISNNTQDDTGIGHPDKKQSVPQ